MIRLIFSETIKQMKANIMKMKINVFSKEDDDIMHNNNMNNHLIENVFKLFIL